MDEPFTSAEGKLGRVIVLRMKPGSDLLDGMLAACEKHQIRNGVIISAIGSLNGVHYCDVEALPDKRCGYGYGRELYLDGPIELTSASGVICSDDDGSINLHVHINMSDKYGNAYGGHLVRGTRVLLTADIVLGEIEDIQMLRKLDPEMEVFLLSPRQK